MKIKAFAALARIARAVRHAAGRARLSTIRRAGVFVGLLAAGVVAAAQGSGEVAGGAFGLALGGHVLLGH